MKPIQRGARVRYHGSLPEYHGTDFIVSNLMVLHYKSPDYPDGIAYSLAELGGGARGARLSNVRRTSFEVVSTDHM
jgi:hypothetical protein